MRTGKWGAWQAGGLGLLPEPLWRELLDVMMREREASRWRRVLLAENTWDATVMRDDTDSAVRGDAGGKSGSRWRVVMSRRGDGVRVEIPFVVEPVSLPVKRVVVRAGGFTAKGSSVESVFRKLIRVGMESASVVPRG